jgi:hypothetical protein
MEPEAPGAVGLDPRPRTDADADQPDLASDLGADAHRPDDRPHPDGPDAGPDADRPHPDGPDGPDAGPDADGPDADRPRPDGPGTGPDADGSDADLPHTGPTRPDV